MTQPQHHRSLGLALLRREQRVMRQHQMHARRLHGGESRNRVLQLSFKRPLVVHLFVELRTHPVRLVEQLESHAPALRTALRRRRQPRLVQILRRHRSAGPIRRNIEGNAGGASVPAPSGVHRPDRVPHKASASPSVTHTTSDPAKHPTSRADGRQPAASGAHCRACETAPSASVARAPARCWTVNAVCGLSVIGHCRFSDSMPRSKLHTHHLLIGRDCLVAHRQRQFETHIRLLRGNHRVVNVHAGSRQ